MFVCFTFIGLISEEWDFVCPRPLRPLCLLQKALNTSLCLLGLTGSGDTAEDELHALFVLPEHGGPRWGVQALVYQLAVDPLSAR